VSAQKPGFGGFNLGCQRESNLQVPTSCFKIFNAEIHRNISLTIINQNRRRAIRPVTLSVLCTRGSDLGLTCPQRGDLGIGKSSSSSTQSRRETGGYDGSTFAMARNLH